MSELTGTSPIAADTLAGLVADSFKDHTANLNNGISALLNSVSSQPEAKAYKFIVTATEVETGAVRTFAGAFWDDSLDGIFVHELKEERVVVTIAWIHM